MPDKTTRYENLKGRIEFLNSQMTAAEINSAPWKGLLIAICEELDRLEEKLSPQAKTYYPGAEIPE